MNERPDKTCDDCRHFWQKDMRPTALEGECRRWPLKNWVKDGEDYWCGEFKAKPPAEGRITFGVHGDSRTFNTLYEFNAWYENWKIDGKAKP